MSEPVTNAQIEDVLTSIRRLVSENRRDPSDGDAAGAAPLAKVERPDPAPQSAPPALVLTPALRIGEAEEAAEDAAVEEDAPGTFETEHDDTDADALGAFEAEDWDASEPDEAQESALFSVDDTQGDVFGASFAEDDDADNDADMAEEVAGDGLEELSAPVEALAAHEFDETIEVSDDAEEVVVTDAVEATEPETGAVPQDEDEAEEEDAPFDFDQVREARIVQWRNAESPDDVEEPDAPGDSDYAGTETIVPDWLNIASREADNDSALDDLEDALNAEFVDDLAGDVEAAAMPELANAVDEVPEIDEEILREMVADIVRRELQGALGERITRNVRKLVRREIHRALAAHDLD